LAKTLLLLRKSTGDILNTGRGTLAVLAVLFKHSLETLVQTVKDLRQAHRIESENKLSYCFMFGIFNGCQWQLLQSGNDGNKKPLHSL